MSHSRKKNPSPSSNRHADDKIPPSSSKPYFGGKTWDTITKSEFLKIKESMTPEQRQALKDFTNPAKLANFDPDSVPPEIPDLPTDWQSDLPNTDDILNDSMTKKKNAKSHQYAGEELSSLDRPIWLPEGEDIKKMSAIVRRAVAEIVQPVYKELVAQAHTAMEKSLGLSLVHCLWLEILNQQGSKSVPADLELLLGNDNRQKTIDQFLKLTNVKIRISNILTRLQELRFKQLNRREGENKSVGWAPPTMYQNHLPEDPSVQNPKFDDENQSPDFPAQDQKVQKQESAHENHLPFSLPPYTYPFQQTSNMQNQKFDNQKSTTTNPNLNSHISNLKFQIPQQSDAQNQPPLPHPPSASPQKDPNVQNCNFDDKNQMTDSGTGSRHR
jgi:hypothetical protein